MNATYWFLIGAALLIGVIFVLRNRAATGPDAPGHESTGLTPQQAYERLAELLGPARRTAFDPVVESGDTDEPCSKFGGLPWAGADAGWPVCPGCEKPMHFFVQLDVGSLPTEAGVRGDGLIQLFMCTNPDSKSDTCMETWDHGAASVVVRLIAAEQPGGALTAPGKDVTWPARRVVSWQPIDDYPGYDDLEHAKIESTDDLMALWEQADNRDGTPLNREGDKLGGWPYWVQNPEYGSCRECGARMRLVLQIDSEDNIPFMFGDLGVGHICQCPEHPHVLTWGWACH